MEIHYTEIIKVCIQFHKNTKCKKKINFLDNLPQVEHHKDL